MGCNLWFQYFLPYSKYFTGFDRTLKSNSGYTNVEIETSDIRQKYFLNYTI